MDNTDKLKAIGAIVLLIAAGGLLVYFTGGSDKPTSGDLKAMVEALPDDELIGIRQSLAAQVEEANRTRSGSTKSKFLIGYERQLEEYDNILRDRGIDPDTLETPTLAEVPIRKDEGP